MYFRCFAFFYYTFIVIMCFFFLYFAPSTSSFASFTFRSIVVAMEFGGNFMKGHTESCTKSNRVSKLECCVRQLQSNFTEERKKSSEMKKKKILESITKMQPLSELLLPIGYGSSAWMKSIEKQQRFYFYSIPIISLFQRFHPGTHRAYSNCKGRLSQIEVKNIDIYR